MTDHEYMMKVLDDAIKTATETVKTLNEAIQVVEERRLQHENE